MKIAKRVDLCSGCGACDNFCPVDAIDLIEDKKGFLYPKINELACIGCGKCMQVCPTNNKLNVKSANKEFYGVQIKDKKKRMESQSGGAFTAIAEFILNSSGIVYGVGLDNNLHAIYMRVNNISDLVRLKGSKYVQAKMGNVYKEVYNDLIGGLNVLFSGTACHIAGLISFLKEKQVNIENLLTCDLICHGTNSPQIYNDYLKYIESDYNFDKSRGINFRDKDKGWHSHIESFYNTKGKKIYSDKYANLFYTNFGLRESCYVCQYANLNRVSDITISDFWGIEKIKPEYDDNTGVSVLIISSQKAHKYLKEITTLDTFKISIEDCMQHNMKEPTLKPKNIMKFWNEYANEGFIYVLKKYGRSPMKKVFIRKIIDLLEITNTKGLIKRILKG